MSYTERIIPIPTIFGTYTIEITDSEDYFDPRKEFDGSTGIMAAFHKRYNLGDKTDIDFNWFSNWNEMEAYILAREKAVVILPLYLLDHSGITMNTTGFHNGWDSGQVGFIYTTREKIKENFGWIKLTPNRIAKIKEHLKGEVEAYDDYLTGNVFDYEIKDPAGEVVGSCSMYFGDVDKSGILVDATYECNRIIKDEYKARFEQIKAWIKNKVPIIHRKFVI